jgi:hypothetical protein
MPRWLNRLVFTLSAVAAILWLLPLFASHSVLFPAGPGFEDIIVYQGRFTVYHTLKFFTSRAFSGFAYPPGAAPIYEVFYATSDAVQAYLLLAGATTLTALAAAYLFLRRNGSAKLFPLFLFFCFPLIFLIQRANIEIVLWVIIVLGVLAYRRGAAILAAVLFGIAASIKLYPILLLGLFLKPASRRTRQDLPAFAIGLVTTVVALIAATAYTGPTFLLAAHGFTTGVDRFQDHYVDTVSKVEVAFDHSLFSPLKYLAYSNHASPAPWTQTYYLIAGAFALLLFVRVRTLPFLNRAVFLLAAMVSLPPVSFTYTLVHLYLPLLLLLCALAASRKPPPATAVIVCALLLFLMLPLVSLYVFQPLPTGPIQSFVLLAILILSALTAWPDAPGSKAL